MAIKCVYSVRVSGVDEYDVTIKHVKYATQVFKCNGTCSFTFESFINWDVNSFVITANKDITVRSIHFKIPESHTLPISCRIQKVDNVDLYPERTKMLKENSHRWVGDPFFANHLKTFVPMNILVNSVGSIRFSTKKVLYS
jgi:hypothetical protein